MKKNKKPIIDPVIKRFYLPTQDNWAPNYPRNTVMITFYYLDKTNAACALKKWAEDLVWFKVTVWGADDTGMDIEFAALYKEKEFWKEQILKELDRFPNPLNKDWLLNNGFSYV